MAGSKRLWLRLRELEDDYRALVVAVAATPGDPHAWCHTNLANDRDILSARTRLDDLRKEVTALRHRFGLPELPALDPPPQPPRVCAHQLPPGKFHPVAAAEVTAALAQVPPWHLAGLARVVLTDSRRDRHASYGRGEVRLSYPVDAGLCVRLRRYEGWSEVSRFGAQMHENAQGRYVSWDPVSLRAYVLRHLLLHEVGHHVALLRGFGYAVSASRREEEFAENYAHAVYDPGRD